MIDWLDFTIEVEHKPIPQGTFEVVEYDGEILFKSSRLRKVEGSYSSSIQVCSRSIRDFYAKPLMELTNKNGDAMFKFNDNGENSTAISFFGNPVKYLQGHNVIGSDCLRSYASELIRDILPKLDFSQSVVDDCLDKIHRFEFWVTRIDITEMLDLGTTKDVQNYLAMMPSTVKARGDRCDYNKSTFYVGKHSTTWTLKFYDKYKEITSGSKKHRLDPIFSETGLLEFAKGKLRAELTLRKKQLDLLDASHASKLQPQLRALYIDHMGRMTMTDQNADIDNIYELSPRHQATFFKWQQGKMPITFLPKSTFYDHKKIFLENGIDISLPPIDSQERLVHVQPLHKVLEPSLVSWDDIPKDLMPYIIKPATHLRLTA